MSDLTAVDRLRRDDFLAVDLGGSFMRMARIGTGPRDISEVARTATETHDLERFLDDMASLAERLGQGLAPRAPLVVASAGLCDPATGLITTANIPCLDAKPAARLISDRLGRPVTFVNDADAFALAEATFGEGKDHRVVFGAIIGTGVGGGVVVDGRLLSGGAGTSGEWGHGPVANPLPQAANRPIPRMRCGCGQTGCVDTFGGARGLERLHGVLGYEPSGSTGIVGRWREGEAQAGRTVAIWAEMLAEPLSMAVNLLGASIVITGGGMGRDEGLMALLDREVRARVLPKHSEPLLRPGTINDAALSGAAVLGRQVMDTM